MMIILMCHTTTVKRTTMWSSDPTWVGWALTEAKNPSFNSSRHVTMLKEEMRQRFGVMYRCPYAPNARLLGSIKTAMTGCQQVGTVVWEAHLVS